MKLLFRILFLILVTPTISYAQRHQILRKSIDVNKDTSVILNIENMYVAIEESTDGKIHFDYLIEFEGFSKKQIRKIIEGFDVDVSDFDNGITLTAKSKNQVNFETIQFKVNYGITMINKKYRVENDSVVRKSKDSLLREIKENNLLNRSKKSLKFINNRFKKFDKEGNLTNIRKGNMDIVRSQFVIKIPSFVKLNINTKNSGVHFRNDMRNELSIAIKQGTLKTKRLFNDYNNVIVDNANFEAEEISGGTYGFKNVRNGKIGIINDAKINSEFSKIEIGEIDKNVVITDFNSEYWLYNWSRKFGRFNLYSEYSKIHLFSPKDDYSLRMFGNNTKNFVGKFEINMQSTNKGEKYRMMEREAKGEGIFMGDIYFDIVHGIIYSHDDLIKKIKN